MKIGGSQGGDASDSFWNLLGKPSMGDAGPGVFEERAGCPDLSRKEEKG